MIKLLQQTNQKKRKKQKKQRKFTFHQKKDNNLMWHYCIKMEFQKIVNFLDTTSDNIDLLLKNGLKFMINQEEITMLIKKLESKHQC